MARVNVSGAPAELEQALERFLAEHVKGRGWAIRAQSPEELEVVVFDADGTVERWVVRTNEPAECVPPDEVYDSDAADVVLGLTFAEAGTVAQALEEAAELRPLDSESDARAEFERLAALVGSRMLSAQRPG